MAKSDFSCVETRFPPGYCHCAAVLFLQVLKLCTDLDLDILYILISFPSARRLLSAALLERWPQVCRVKITFAVLSTNRFVSTTKKSMKCVSNWIPLRIRVRSRNTQPHLKLGLDIFDFCAISRRRISKIRFPHPISVVVTIYGARFVLRDSKRRALENKFSCEFAICS